MKENTIRRKMASRGFRRMTQEEEAASILANIIHSGKRALDQTMLDIGRMVAESIMLMEREEISGPDYFPRDSKLKKWAHEDGSVYIGDQKVKVKRPRLRSTDTGEIDLESYQKLRNPFQFSEELLGKVLRGISMQKYKETLVNTANAFGVCPTTVSNRVVEATTRQLKEFQERSLEDFHPFAILMDGIHRGGDVFIVAQGIDVNGDKKVLGFWEGSSENHGVCESLLRDLERRGLRLSNKIIFITDGGSGLIKTLRDRFGKKLLHQRCVLHKSRNIQEHLPKKYRKEAHKRLRTALEQNSYSDAKKMMEDLEKWLRRINESAADSLKEAFNELLLTHRLQIPILLRKSLMSTNQIESTFSLVRHCERNIKRPRGSLMLQRWLAASCLYSERQFKKVKGHMHIKKAISFIKNIQQNNTCMELAA